MPGISTLFAFALRQVTDVPAARVVDALRGHFTDHGPALTAALQRANERPWQSLALALAGDGLLGQLKALFAGGDRRGVAEQVRLFLADNAGAFPGATADFRRQCLADLKKARRLGLLSGAHVPPDDLARQADAFHGYAGRDGLVGGAHAAVAGVADGLAGRCPDLARLLRTPTPGAPPLLAVAFSFFLRREIEGNAELARGLMYDHLRQLHSNQVRGFESVEEVLRQHGQDVVRVLDKLGDIEASILDLQELLQLLHERGRAEGTERFDHIEALLAQLLDLLGRFAMHKGEVNPRHTCSIRSEIERRLVRELLDRYRGLSVEEQERFPALINGLGKLRLGIGDKDGAGESFQAAARQVTDRGARAEAHYNAYLAALEQKDWVAALREILEAAELDPGRFEPFDLHRYQVKELLGAGGFGTVFRCYDGNFRREVAIKSLAAEIDPGQETAFGEAHALQALSHPAIIQVFDCGHADSRRKANPYIVMEYFPGVSLEQYIRTHGQLPLADALAVAELVARGMQAAHERGILHRDIKPDNVLVRKDGGRWEVKVIDFGLAMRRSTVETGMASRPAGKTMLNHSVAGTLRYAPPEQLGDAPGVKVGPYSDVYSFAKLVCYILFQNPQPYGQLLSLGDTRLRELLVRCLEQEAGERPAGFEPVLEALTAVISQPAPGAPPDGDRPGPDPVPAAAAARRDPKPGGDHTRSPRAGRWRVALPGAPPGARPPGARPRGSSLRIGAVGGCGTWRSRPRRARAAPHAWGGGTGPG